MLNSDTDLLRSAINSKLDPKKQKDFRAGFTGADFSADIVFPAMRKSHTLPNPLEGGRISPLFANSSLAASRK